MCEIWKLMALMRFSWTVHKRACTVCVQVAVRLQSFALHACISLVPDSCQMRACIRFELSHSSGCRRSL